LTRSPILVYFPIQLCLSNTYTIFPIGRLEYVEVDLGGFKIVVDFKVVEILYEKDTYLALLGIKWVYDGNGIINLKKGNMSFQSKNICMI
jgi:hypothetical protein